MRSSLTETGSTPKILVNLAKMFTEDSCPKLATVDVTFDQTHEL